MVQETPFKPLPSINKLNAPYWEGAKRHELRLMQCKKCGWWRSPVDLNLFPSEICPNCHTSDPPEWRKVSGKGKVITWVVMHKVFNPAFANDVPYPVVVTELEEGVRILTNILDCKPEELRYGMPVEVVFQDINDQITLPQVRKVKG